MCFERWKSSNSSSESQNEVDGGFFLDIEVSESASILELFASEDESLLISGDSFSVGNLSLDALNSIG